MEVRKATIPLCNPRVRSVFDSRGRRQPNSHSGVVEDQEGDPSTFFLKKAVGQFDAVGACVFIDLSRASREELMI